MDSEDHLGQGSRSSQEVIEGIDVVWLKTPPWRGNGFSRGCNMVMPMKQSNFHTK